VFRRRACASKSVEFGRSAVELHLQLPDHVLVARSDLGELTFMGAQRFGQKV
jgi:hypothetical protein